MAIPLLQEKFSNSGEGDSKLDHHPEQNEPATDEESEILQLIFWRSYWSVRARQSYIWTCSASAVKEKL